MRCYNSCTIPRISLESENTVDNNSLVEYSCGCIGFPPSRSGRSIILKPCDKMGSEPNLMMIYKMMEDTRFEKVSEIVTDQIIDQVNQLIEDGHRFRELKSILTD